MRTLFAILTLSTLSAHAQQSLLSAGAITNYVESRLVGVGATPTNAIQRWIWDSNNAALFDTSGFVRIGTNAFAGSQSVAIGSYKTSYVNSVTVQGFANRNDVAVGAGSQAFTNSVAIGLNTWATNAAVSVGIGAQSSNGVAIGRSAASKGSGGVAIGQYATATNHSLSIGDYLDNYIPGTALLQGLHVGSTTNWNVQYPYGRLSVIQSGHAFVGPTNGGWVKLASMQDATNVVNALASGSLQTNVVTSLIQTSNSTQYAWQMPGGWKGGYLIDTNPTAFFAPNVTNQHGTYSIRDPGIIYNSVDGKVYCYYVADNTNAVDNLLDYFYTCLATSADYGRTWTQHGPVLTNSASGWRSHGVCSPRPFIDSNGDVYVFFIGDSVRLDIIVTNMWTIGVARAPASSNWTVAASYTILNNDLPVVQGSGWETNGTGPYWHGAYAPTVWQAPDGSYTMAYNVGPTEWGVCFATSTNLTNWTKLTSSYADALSTRGYMGHAQGSCEEPDVIRLPGGGLVMLLDGVPDRTNDIDMVRMFYSRDAWGTNAAAWNHMGGIIGFNSWHTNGIGSPSWCLLPDNTFLVAYTGCGAGESPAIFRNSIGFAYLIPALSMTTNTVGYPTEVPIVKQWDRQVQLNTPFAIGRTAKFNTNAAFDAGSIALGNYTEATGNYAFAAGHDAHALGNFSVAVGLANYATAQNSHVYGFAGTNSIANSILFNMTNGFYFNGSPVYANLLASTNYSATNLLKGATGSAGQVLTATSSGVAWSNAPAIGGQTQWPYTAITNSPWASNGMSSFTAQTISGPTSITTPLLRLLDDTDSPANFTASNGTFMVYLDRAIYATGFTGSGSGLSNVVAASLNSATLATVTNIATNASVWQTNVISEVNLGLARISGSTTNTPLDFARDPMTFVTMTNSINWVHATNQLAAGKWRLISLRCTNATYTMSFPSAWTKLGPFTTNGVTLGASNGYWMVSTISMGLGQTNVTVTVTPPNN